MYDLMLRGGVVVCPTGPVRADLALEGGQIAALGPDLAGEAQEERDVSGLHLFPGVIDVHVHFNEPGRTDWEGIASGSSALAAGGGTLFFDMPLNSSPPVLDPASFAAKLERMRQHALTDYGLWGGLTPRNLDQLEALAACGAVGFKAFMSNSGLDEFAAVDDFTLLEGMRIAASLGRIVAVHAENDGLTAAYAARARAAGRVGIRDYLESRPAIAELEAVNRACLYALDTGCKLHLVHLSSARSVALALEWRLRGADVSLETCPHYLSFSDLDLERVGPALKCAPPLRSSAEREALWAALGGVDLIASDHSPAPPELKTSPDFFAVWGGIAGVQSSLELLLTEGYHARGLPLERVAELLSAAPARRFGLTGRGTLEVGMRADLALVDLGRDWTLEPADLRDRHRQNPSQGRPFRGKVLETLLAGRTIHRAGQGRLEGHGGWVRPAR